MLRAEIDQLDVADGGVDSLQQFTIPVERCCADASSFLQRQHIRGIFRKGLPVVKDIALLN